MTTNELKMLRLQTESNALTAVEHDLLDVDSRIAVLEQQITDLTLLLGTARDWRTDVASRRDILRERLAATRRVVSPFSACPEDILRLVFAERARESDAKWTTLGTGTFNKARAQAPFIIAAVCRDWRRVALTTPMIWSYVGVPCFIGDSLPLVAVTRTVIERSCAAPLDILFEDMDDLECKAYTQILDLLFPHLHRWRRVELWSCLSDAPFTSYLRGNATLLEELCVDQIDTSDQWAADPAPFLVGATHLRTVRLRNSSLILDTRSLPSLQSLMIKTTSTMPSTAFWTFFGSTNELTSLVLDLNDWSTVVSGMPNIVEFPKLTRLHLHSYATSILVHYPTLLAAPILTELGLHNLPTDPALSLAQVLDKVPSSTRLADLLQTLCLSDNYISSTAGELVGKLPKLTRLDIKECPSINSGFWDALEHAPGRLTHLRLEKVGFAAGSTEALLTLVRKRKSCQRCSSFVEVEVISTGFTTRDKVELNGLLA
ncbi:hypothetical protein EXIGLDRAFT_843698 [Exidia glandulosa HHB12029]|uniref:F-box domain-containing protein n=1 Tax=Exidia glandulosa HHB12029 TaxID=1314781 RepID=A0A165ZG77_EXIGL|nr:hypothetical protein EXIGLDRAFT_843698 [Exidia glandulosa HHB12029]